MHLKNFWKKLKKKTNLEKKQFFFNNKKHRLKKNCFFSNTTWTQHPDQTPKASPRWWLSGLRHPVKCSWPLSLQLTQLCNCCPGLTEALSPISDPAIARGSCPTTTDDPITTGDLICPDCHSADHLVPQFLSCPAHPMNLSLANMWVAPVQVAQFLAGLPQFSNYLPPLQSVDRLWLLSTFPS